MHVELLKGKDPDTVKVLCFCVDLLEMPGNFPNILKEEFFENAPSERLAAASDILLSLHAAGEVNQTTLTRAGNALLLSEDPLRHWVGDCLMEVLDAV